MSRAICKIEPAEIVSVTPEEADLVEQFHQYDDGSYYMNLDDLEQHKDIFTQEHYQALKDILEREPNNEMNFILS